MFALPKDCPQELRGNGLQVEDEVGFAIWVLSMLRISPREFVLDYELEDSKNFLLLFNDFKSLLMTHKF